MITAGGTAHTIAIVDTRNEMPMMPQVDGSKVTRRISALVMASVRVSKIFCYSSVYLVLIIIWHAFKNSRVMIILNLISDKYLNLITKERARDYKKI